MTNDKLWKNKTQIRQLGFWVGFPLSYGVGSEWVCLVFMTPGAAYIVSTRCVGVCWFYGINNGTFEPLLETNQTCQEF